MRNSSKMFKDTINKEYTDSLIKSSDKGGMMMDMVKLGSEMKEMEKLVGGNADKMSLKDISKKHKIDISFLEDQLKQGVKIEQDEHSNDRTKAVEIAMDHLYEDPKYYTKLKKIEAQETDNLAKKEFASDLQKDKDFQEFKKRAKYNYRGVTDTYGVPNVSSSDPYIKKKTKYGRPGRGKEESKEATTSGSSGAFSAPLFEKDNEFIKKSNAETPKLKEGIASGAMGIDKVEAKEATTGVGGYSTPAMWAKSTKKKDWGPSRKTQIPGGGFVKVKKKCTKFPYCNQGDINALKITKNESVKEAIKNVSKRTGLSKKVIMNILEQEYVKTKKKK